MAVQSSLKCSLSAQWSAVESDLNESIHGHIGDLCVLFVLFCFHCFFFL